MLLFCQSDELNLGREMPCTYFQNMGLNAMDAAATEGVNSCSYLPRSGWNLLARLFWSKSTKGVLVPRKLVMIGIGI